MTPEFETLGYYTAPDFVALGRAYGLDEGAVLDLIRLFRRKSDAVEEMVGNSLLSSEARTEYLRIVHDRLRSSLAFEHFPLDGAVDKSKPLVLAGLGSMSEDAQRKVAAFVRAPGGRSRRFVLKAMEVGYGVL